MEVKTRLLWWVTQMGGEEVEIISLDFSVNGVDYKQGERESETA